MSPATLLHLWRDRWHKPHHPEHSVPMVHGKISRWTMDLARSDNWGLPGLAVAVVWAGLATLLGASTAPLTTNGQLVLGCTLLAVAIYLRRHRGQVFALAIGCMAVLLGLRYFFWRINATLPTHAVSSIVLAWALLIAEMALWLRIGLDYIATIWPVEQESTPLPDDPVLWPTVDIVLLAGESPTETIRRFVSNGIQMDWPHNKYRTLLLSSTHSPDVEAACASAQIAYRVYKECPAQDVGAMLNRALYESDADVLIVAGCEQQIPSHLLRQTIGWFVHEHALAMVQSPWSPLAPRPVDTTLAALDAKDTLPCWAIVRRSSILEIGGFSTHPASERLHTAYLLERAGFFDAYLAVSHHGGQERHYTRLDGPFRALSLPLRIRLDQLRSGLHFYAPWTTAVMMGVPIAALLWRTTPIATDLLSLAVYWLPPWILGRLVLATALDQRRLRWWDFVGQELGALAVLLRTGKSLCITWMQQVARALGQSVKSGERRPAPVRTSFRPGMTIGFLVFSSITVYAAYRAYMYAPVPLGELYLIWSLYWALSFMAELAVQRELDWVHAHRQAGEHLQCMIKLPEDGKILRASTLNFPQLPLVLSLNPEHGILSGQWLHVSLFFGRHEYVFPCLASLRQNDCIEVQVDQEHLAEYRQFAAFVFTRPANWPRWLPHSHADRLLPDWALRLLMRLQDAFYNLVVRPTAPAVFQKIRKWLFPGNPTHG